MLELVAECFAVGELLEEFEFVFVGDRGGEGLQVVLKFSEGAEDFVAVLGDDLSPELGASGGDSCGVAEAVAAVIGGGGASFCEVGS